MIYITKPKIKDKASERLNKPKGSGEVSESER